jgi:hypothetical protein
MPANVTAIGSVTDSYPFTRFASFSVSHLRETTISEYPDGSAQTNKKADNMKRRWQVGHRLSSANSSTMRTFWKAHINSPFNFTDVSNGVIYKAVFVGGWQETRTVGDLYQIVLQVIEIA